MRRLLLGVLLALGMAGCDAGPSAVVHDGDGKAPTAETQKTPFWAESPKGEPQENKTPSDDVEQASMPIQEPSGGNPAAEPSAAEAEIHAKNMAAAKGYAPLAVPKDREKFTASRYGDWPLWSSNRKYSADDNAHYHFEKHGDELGAKSYADYVAIVHDFIHSPPKGTQTLRRNNGDTLFYDAHNNVFAVMTKSGAPRTLFRPYEGAAYWRKQKEIEAGRRTIRPGDDSE